MTPRIKHGDSGSPDRPKKSHKVNLLCKIWKVADLKNTLNEVAEVCGTESLLTVKL